MIIHLYGCSVVFSAHDTQRFGVVFPVHEITYQKSRTTLMLSLHQKFYCIFYICPLTLGLEVQKFTDDIHNMFTSLLRRNVLLYLIRE